MRIWIAGCATGEEAWSMAILLREEGLLERSRIYATDMSSLAVESAQSGIFPLALMREYTLNYQRAGGGELLPPLHRGLRRGGVRCLAPPQHRLLAPQPRE
ncbi:MAG: CheR family methyltransferase [Minicystis sp.]